MYISWREQRGIERKRNYQVVGEIHSQSALCSDLDNLRRICRHGGQPWNTVDFATLYSMETAWVPPTAVSLGKVSVYLFCLTCHPLLTCGVKECEIPEPILKIQCGLFSLLTPRQNT